MRIRTVKPEFFLHEGIFSLEKSLNLPVRLAFQGLWCAADREGRFKWEPRKLKVQILPYDELDFEAILDGLASFGFIKKYVCEDSVFGFIPTFKKHQHINIRESESALPDPESGACTCIQITDSRSVNIPPEIRKLVMDRDGGKCCRCNSHDDPTIDHILPQSMGGNHNPRNLRVLCRKCNSARPVSGDAFIQDIANDGFTIESLHEICKHVHARESTSPARVPSCSLPVPFQGESEGKTKDEKIDRYHPDCRAVLHILNEACGAHYREVHANLIVISKRLFEPGVTIDGVRDMIKRQCRKWKGTSMADYLRPETLFAKSKFDSYYATRDNPIVQDNGSTGSKRFDRNAGTANEGLASRYKGVAQSTLVPKPEQLPSSNNGAPTSV